MKSTSLAPTSAITAVCVIENDLSPCVSRLTANHCRTRSSRELEGMKKCRFELCDDKKLIFTIEMTAGHADRILLLILRYMFATNDINKTVEVSAN